MEAVLAAVSDMSESLLYWPLSIRGSSVFTKDLLSADPRNEFTSRTAPADRLLHAVHRSSMNVNIDNAETEGPGQADLETCSITAEW